MATNVTKRPATRASGTSIVPRGTVGQLPPTGTALDVLLRLIVTGADLTHGDVLSRLGLVAIPSAVRNPADIQQRIM
jgi:hypothetical protein